jgi:CheY-like chemotaxis protein
MNAPRGNVADQARPLALVVEDYADARAMYAELLEHHGYDVLTASDGSEALDVLRSARPSYVLLDLSLPRVSGWEVAERIREHPELRRAYVVAITAHDHPIAIDRARRAGASGSW